MENEEELNLEEETTEEPLKTKNRFKQLSDTVKKTAEERDEAAAKAETLEKERNFYKDFSANVSKYPNASEYQEQILEKVKAGYSTEDAMVSVLAKEGKLTRPEPETVDPGQIEGGSAPTVSIGDKTLEQMTTDEKFQALRDMEASGALSQALRGR